MNYEQRGIRKATLNDRMLLVNIIATSFEHDPCFAWMLSKSRRTDKINILSEYLVDETLCKGEAYITSDNLGAALWHTANKEPVSINYIKRNLGFLWKIGPASVVKCLKVSHHKERHFPLKRFYRYLACIGVLPQGRGKGLANNLILPILEQSSREDTPVFLETANENNVSIYEKKGFRLTDTVHENSMKLYFMRYL